MTRWRRKKRVLEKIYIRRLGRRGGMIQTGGKTGEERFEGRLGR